MCESSTRCGIDDNMKASHRRAAAPATYMEVSRRRVVAPVANMEASHRRAVTPVAKMRRARHGDALVVKAEKELGSVGLAEQDVLDGICRRR